MSNSAAVSLREALEREHREIDAGIEAYLDDPSATDGLAAAFTALRRHIYLEEEFLFPPLRAQGLMAPVLVMLREHGELWTALDDLEPLLADDAPPPAVQLALRQVLDLLDRHNAKEEPIVYGTAERTLGDDDAARLSELVATSTMPDTWVCQQARTA